MKYFALIAALLFSIPSNACECGWTGLSTPSAWHDASAPVQKVQSLLQLPPALTLGGDATEFFATVQVDNPMSKHVRVYVYFGPVLVGTAHTKKDGLFTWSGVITAVDATDWDATEMCIVSNGVSRMETVDQTGGETVRVIVYGGEGGDGTGDCASLAGCLIVRKCQKQPPGGEPAFVHRAARRIKPASA